MVPTSNKSVTYKSLNRNGNDAKIFSDRCRSIEKLHAVTYDLAIAKIAMQMQHEENPKYDGVFIALGSFFKVLGKIIAECEEPYILEECGISIKSFVLGLHYNKCKRMNEILAAAFEVLHFGRFLDTQEDIEEIVEIIKLEIKIIETHCSVYSKEADKILDRYDKFCQETEN